MTPSHPMLPQAPQSNNPLSAHTARAIWLLLLAGFVLLCFLAFSYSQQQMAGHSSSSYYYYYYFIYKKQPGHSCGNTHAEWHVDLCENSCVALWIENHKSSNRKRGNVPTLLLPPKTMAVLKANGKPIPAAPDPQLSLIMLSEISHVPLPLFFGQKPSSRHPVWVWHDPGTLSHVQHLSYCLHDIHPPLHITSKTRQHSTSSFELQHKSDQQQQFMLNHHWGNPSHQQQTESHHHQPHMWHTKSTDHPVLNENTSQETNDIVLLTGNYVTGDKLQQVTTTDIPDCFTPIVCSHGSEYSQPLNSTTQSYCSNILTLLVRGCCSYCYIDCGTYATSDGESSVSPVKYVSQQLVESGEWPQLFSHERINRKFQILCSENLRIVKKILAKSENGESFREFRK